MKPRIALFIAALGVAACAPTADNQSGPPEKAVEASASAFDEASLFPVDRSLVRPEDGIVLADGTLLVADQRYGLVALSPDGSTRPFGDFAAVGYVHEPPTKTAGPNGVALEPDGAHVLVADVFTGSIWRTDIASGTTQLAYQHAFGVNTAVRDSTGAIWFSQSTENIGPNSEERLFEAIDMPMADGALFRLAPASGDTPPVAELKASGLFFANGIVVDEARGALYVAETLADRVNAFPLSVADGALGEKRILANVLTPDNVEMDDMGRVWVASPLGNAILRVDPDSGDVRSVFHPQTAESDRIVAEWHRRGESGEPRLDLMGPGMSAPLPGGLTGIILSPGDGPAYASGLGDALVKLDLAEQ